MSVNAGENVVGVYVGNELISGGKKELHCKVIRADVGRYQGWFETNTGTLRVTNVVTQGFGVYGCESIGAEGTLIGQAQVGNSEQNFDVSEYPYFKIIGIYNTTNKDTEIEFYF